MAEAPWVADSSCAVAMRMQSAETFEALMAIHTEWLPVLHAPIFGEGS